jgi:hypothetical protein
MGGAHSFFGCLLQSFFTGVMPTFFAGARVH